MSFLVLMFFATPQVSHQVNKYNGSNLVSLGGADIFLVLKNILFPMFPCYRYHTQSVLFNDSCVALSSIYSYLSSLSLTELPSLFLKTANCK